MCGNWIWTSLPVLVSLVRQLDEMQPRNPRFAADFLRLIPCSSRVFLRFAVRPVEDPAMKLSISNTVALAIVFFSISPLAAAELPKSE